MTADTNSDSPLRTTSWLANSLDSDLAILDATWTWAGSQGQPDKNFSNERIPGSLYFDHSKVADLSSPYTDTCPSDDHFFAHMETLGIRSDQVVIVYSQKGTAGGASRAWWLMRRFGHRHVYVLDGGLIKWKAEGHPLETAPPDEPKTSSYMTQTRPELRIDLATLRQQQESKSVQILDARPPKYFAGHGIFPSGNDKIPDVEPGRIPGSLNFPSSSVVDSDTKTLKTPEELGAMLAELGVELDRPVATTCSIGIGASTAALAIAVAGGPIPAVFDGAWQLWGSDPSTPKVKGP